MQSVRILKSQRSSIEKNKQIKDEIIGIDEIIK